MRMSYWRTPAHNIGRSHAKIMRHEIGCCLIFSGISENSGDFRIASVKIVHVLFSCFASVASSCPLLFIGYVIGTLSFATRFPLCLF